MKKGSSVVIRILWLALALSATEVCAENYDPLAVSPAPLPAPVELTMHDAARNRGVPLRIYLPANTTPEPVILFSHGLGGSRTGSAPREGGAGKAFGAVKIPWLLMTGTKDIAPIGHEDLKSRLAVYPALQGAPKYEVVLYNAEHSAFTDRALPGDREPRNPNHHRVMLALSTAFWDAYLRGDAGALAWLNGSGPPSVLEAKDRWQFSAP